VNLYQAHSDTSREAAERIEPTAGTLRRKVLDYMRVVREATDERMQDELRLNPSTQRPRRIELVASGHLRDSGRTALTKSGRKAVLWEIVDEPKQGGLW
jgi:hypothetical protein